MTAANELGASMSFQILISTEDYNYSRESQNIKHVKVIVHAEMLK